MLICLVFVYRGVWSIIPQLAGSLESAYYFLSLGSTQNVARFSLVDLVAASKQQAALLNSKFFILGTAVISERTEIVGVEWDICLYWLLLVSVSMQYLI